MIELGRVAYLNLLGLKSSAAVDEESGGAVSYTHLTLPTIYSV